MLSIVIAVTLVAFAWSWHAALYRGEGVLQMPTVSLSDYKRYAITLLDGATFMSFLRTRKDFTPEDIAFVRSQMPTGEGASRWIRPAFAFTKGDVKDLPELLKLENQVVGADIQVEGRNPEFAHKLANAVGEYLGDAIVRGRILDLVGSNLNNTRTLLGKLENEALQNQFLLTQQQQRLADMRAISRRYPEAARENPRQVVSLENGGERYFSPITQIVGLESYIAEINETVRKLDRDRETLESDLAFYTLARDRIDKATLGREKLALLETALVDAFRNRDTARDAVRESNNTVKLNVGQIRYLANDGLRFIAPPVVRDPSYGRVLAITAAAAVAGALLAALVSLALAWGESLRTTQRGT